MQDFHSALKQILSCIFQKTHSACPIIKEQLQGIPSNLLSLQRLNANNIFIERHAPLDYIYLLADGVAYVVNHTLDGRRIIADTFTDPQIFGLIEAVNNDISYRGTVVTLSKATVFKVNKQRFLETIYSDLELSTIIIRYLSNLSIHAMTQSENKSARSPYDNLIIYLYNKSLGKKLPYRLKDSKAFIADSLQINKRSLYRYLNQLTEEGIIKRERQDIMIAEEQFNKIESHFNSINEY